ncbi:2-dehydropantoate 2-reductase [Anaeromyxobacter oryzae]|uniref:2-dehydropantoate 2-reductase n=1 Tax=Anaeromyxobacter oryzae TaxID=2918170 RepID=A0ABM7WUR9_9BACT|nr:2-dehydropantoate 2-reductase [Anaeromyxobacter oryzae]BDG03230.1 2-dehydropantoate 2-reductase [Anaeromyxobacter oryzae]
MRIAVIGAGGVGGLLAALLARAGEEVSVVARGSALDAIRAAGITVDSPLGAFTQRVAAASDDPATLAPADAVLVAVKAWQVAELAPRLAPLVAPGGVVVPLQNGVEAAGRLAAALGDERVAGGLVNVLAWITGPGAVKHVGGPPRLTVGERGARGKPPSPRLEALAAALGRGGAEATISGDIERASWEKFLLIGPWGAVSAVARAPIGVVRTVPETRALLEAAMEELAAVGRARGVAIPADAVARTLAFIDAVMPEATASMQRDVGAGRPSELDDQAGAVVRLAAAVGVPVPVHGFLLAALRPQEAAARGAIPRFART